MKKKTVIVVVVCSFASCALTLAASAVFPDYINSETEKWYNPYPTALFNDNSAGYNTMTAMINQAAGDRQKTATMIRGAFSTRSSSKGADTMDLVALQAAQNQRLIEQNDAILAELKKLNAKK